MCADSARLPRRVAVIGASGFIGQTLVRQLRDRGDRVAAVVRPGSPRRALIPAGVDVYEAALVADDPRLVDALRGADAVVYAAGVVRGWTLEDFLNANVRGVFATAGAMTAVAPEALLVLVSSLAASEPELSAYAMSKRMGEHVLEECRVGRWAIIRPTAVYGPGDREMRPVLELIRHGVLPCLAGPEQRLSFIHVDDVARAIVAAIDHPAEVDHQTYTLDDGTAGGYDRAAMARAMRPGRRTLRVRIPRVALAMSAAVNLRVARWRNAPPMLTPGKVGELTFPRWVGDNAPFAAATGWRPAHDLASGAAQTLAGPR